MKRKWHAAKTSNDQGLVIDDETGENIAVTYKAENARLVASAPELLEALEALLEMVTDNRLHGPEVMAAASALYTAKE